MDNNSLLKARTELYNIVANLSTEDYRRMNLNMFLVFYLSNNKRKTKTKLNILINNC